MSKKEIKIIVEGKKTLPYKEIIETQGQLKSLSKENYEKLKQLFLQEDFAFCLNIAMVKGKPFGLLDGHQRLRTIRTMVEEEGYQLVDIKGKPTNKLPVTVTHCKNKEHAGQLILSAVSQFGKIDEEGLYEFINEFAVDINSLETFDLPDFDVDSFIESYAPEDPNAETEDDIPEEVEPVCKLGDLWQLGKHRLLCGDSTKKEDVERLMNGEKADMVFTDPPYLMDFTGGIHADGSKSFNSVHGRIKNDKMTKSDGDKFLDSINKIIKDFVNGAYYITFYRLGVMQYLASLERVGLQNRAIIIWEKGNHTLSNSDYMSRYEPIFYGWVNEHKFYGGNNGVDVWHIDRTKKNELHPTMKPIELCVKAISDGSAGDDLILDLFLGSGSTLIACEKTNRICYGMELDPHYCDVIL